MQQTPNYCYILFNKSNNKTYVGYTNNPTRRIRQHNGEIKGGARATTRSPTSSPWNFALLITAVSSDASPNTEAFDNKKALSLEWHMKHTRPKPKTRGMQGRIATLYNALQLPKFNSLAFTINVHPDFFQRINSTLEGMPNIDIRVLSPTTLVAPLTNVLPDTVPDTTAMGEEVFERLL